MALPWVPALFLQPFSLLDRFKDKTAGNLRRNCQ
jgi:hypothetical protein